MQRGTGCKASTIAVGAVRRAGIVGDDAKDAGDAQGRVGPPNGERDGGWVKMAGKIPANARAHGRANAQVPRASTSRYRADERGIVVDADTALEACQPTINRHQTTRCLNNTGAVIARDDGIRDHGPIGRGPVAGRNSNFRVIERSRSSMLFDTWNRMMQLIRI